MLNKMYKSVHKSTALSSDQSTRKVIDMRSDTLSQPTPEMRVAMANAEVGDDVYGEDPTVNELERRCAEMFDKEAALFVPSGTMANLIAVMIHCGRRGTEAIVGDLSHVFLFEQGGSAQVAGVQINLISNKPDGTYCLKEFRKKIRFYDQHEPITALAIVENTHNICGGKILPLEFLDELSEVCRPNQIKIHMDGARIFNAAEESGVPVSRITRDVDSVCFCLSKSLSAPVGSILLGTKEFIHDAHRYRKVLGGGMRQVGILAAAGLYSLEHIVPKLQGDHQRLRRLAEAIDALNSPLVQVDLSNLHTNILILQMVNETKISPVDFTKRLAEITAAELASGIVDASGRGIIVLVGARDWKFVRMVIYHEIGEDDVDLAIKKITYCIQEIDRNS